jgi:hypothetical protein
MEEEDLEKRLIKKTLDNLNSINKDPMGELLGNITKKIMVAQQERIKLQGAADYFGEFEGVDAPNEKFKAIDTLLDNYSKISD